MITKTKRLKELIARPQLDFLLEAHSGLSAKLVEEAGFEGIWASGLSMSAALGVRDNNEASWTQILEVLEFMSDATKIPILLDGDTGYGNFNNMRRLVQKLEQRQIAGVCIEDKLFPKTNSFIGGKKQPLADIDEFAGKIKAGKDAQRDENFCIVARTEAFIAGWGLGEALKRAESYRQAGADAVLIHSKHSKPDEILLFKKEWGDRLPVVIVPTKYYSTPTEVFREAKFSVAIWANHLLRSSLASMQKTAAAIQRDESLINVEDDVASVTEIFRLQGTDELDEAEKRYLPNNKKAHSALILAASRGGTSLGDLTKDKPKAMIVMGNRSVLQRQVDLLNEIGVKDICVVRGYKKETMKIPNIRFVDNDAYETTQEVYSFAQAFDRCQPPLIVSYGDILFKKYMPLELMESTTDLHIICDANWKNSRNRGRYADFVQCSHPYERQFLGQEAKLLKVSSSLKDSEISGEWIGLMKMTEAGYQKMASLLEILRKRIDFKSLRMADLLNQWVEMGHTAEVSYTQGNWADIDDFEDLAGALHFG